MSQDKTWSQEAISTTQDEISCEILPLVQNEQYVEGIEHCLGKILPLETNERGDMVIICYVIAVLNLMSYSREANAEYKNLVIKLEKIAKSLLEKNNIKAGKSKLSFLHGQLQQGLSAILKNDGDTWGALWEASLGPVSYTHLTLPTICSV